jgi:hypothetical protein
MAARDHSTDTARVMDRSQRLGSIYPKLPLIFLVELGPLLLHTLGKYCLLILVETEEKPAAPPAIRLPEKMPADSLLLPAVEPTLNWSGKTRRASWPFVAPENS